ncbi:MAG: HAD-IC family P-type ATPase, partial [Coriobacteriales bacterium]|nr:HAD-IC family P-type ATPase [Coriobacteriales bacterium]
LAIEPEELAAKPEEWVTLAATESTAPLASSTISDISELAGMGVRALVDGKEAAIGSVAFVSLLADLEESAIAAIDKVESKGASAVLLAYDNQILAILSIRDTLRAESRSLMQQLHTGNLSLETVMLTGDNLKTAQVIAAEAGVKRVHAGLLPEDKMDYIERERQNQGTVAFVGDGINDALALAAADVGIAMGAAGSDIALEVADVALMADHLGELPFFFKLSRKVILTIRISVAFTLAVKAAVMALAVVGLSQMWMAIAADVGMLLLVLLYGMRLAYLGKPKATAGV